jgi:hypothetical protein
MANKALQLAAGILFGIVTVIFAINYYYYYYSHPVRPFYPPPPTSGRLDKFGVKEIYLSKQGGEEWYLSSYDPQKDPRTGGEGPPTTFLQQNNDGSWKVQSTEVRYGVLTSSGYHPDLITTLNQDALAAKGYIQSPNDCKRILII